MILTGTHPTDIQLNKLLRVAEEMDFSYSEIGQSLSMPSSLALVYNIDHYSCVLGQGERVFEIAKEGLQRWIPFDLGWVQIEAANPVEGLTVPVCIRVSGVWSVHFCRVVYVHQSAGEGQGWCFAYGTLEQHAEQGEEKFAVTYNPQTQDVVFEIAAFSRPRHLLGKVVYPLTRALQKKFAHASMRRLQRWIADERV